jgi:hypothetical protein
VCVCVCDRERQSVGVPMTLCVRMCSVTSFTVIHAIKEKFSFLL